MLKSSWRRCVIAIASVAALTLGLSSCAGPAAAPAAPARELKAAAPAAPESPLALAEPVTAGALESPLLFETVLAGTPLAAAAAAQAAPEAAPGDAALALRFNLLQSYGPNPFVELASEVIRPNTVHPPRLVPMDDPYAGIRVFGAYQTLSSGFHDGKRTLPGLVLMAPNAAVEITWPEPTTTVGVQLWGDNNEGCARILVDSQEMWLGDTREQNSINFEGYVQIANLPAALHTVRVQPYVDTRCPEAGDVTVVAFGWGAIGEGFRNYLPFVAR